MARITKKGLLGSIGTLRCFIDANGNHITEKGGPTTTRVMNDPEYAGFRKRMVDFGACSHFGKHLRISLRRYAHLFKPKIDTYLNGKLSMVCKADTANPQGKRTIDIKNSGSFLVGSEFCNRNLNDFVLQEFPLTINEDRNSINMSIHSFTPVNVIQFPDKATKFSFIMTVTVVSKFKFMNGTQRHEFVEMNPFSESFVALTDMKSKQEIFEGADLQIDLGMTPNENQGLIVCFGIKFYEPEGFEERLQKDSYAFRVMKTC